MTDFDAFIAIDWSGAKGRYKGIRHEGWVFGVTADRMPPDRVPANRVAA